MDARRYGKAHDVMCNNVPTRKDTVQQNHNVLEEIWLPNEDQKMFICLCNQMLTQNISCWCFLLHHGSCNTKA